jgi:hypothetical protein
MNRMYQWLGKRVGTQRRETVEREPRRTFRTVETVERQEQMVFIRTLQPGTFEACPLCGHRMVPSAEDAVQPRLLE